MKLYLLRHGTAEPRPGKKGDARRALVSKGREQCGLVAALLVRIGAFPDRIVSSPYDRAAQTAEEVRRGVGFRGPVELDPRLEPGASVAAAADAALEQNVRRTLVVGHEPRLGELAAFLCGNPGLRIDLRKGGLVEVELSSTRPPRGALLGLLRPRHLRE